MRKTDRNSQTRTNQRVTQSPGRPAFLKDAVTSQVHGSLPWVGKSSTQPWLKCCCIADVAKTRRRGR